MDVVPITDPACGRAWQRLLALCELWATRRGSNAWNVLNGGAPPPDRPKLLYPFRWQQAAQAIAFAAGHSNRPPDQYSALPLGLQTFLAHAVPRALSAPPTRAVDRDALQAVEREADQWLGTWGPPCPAASATTPRWAGDGRQQDTTDLLAAALAPGPAPTHHPAVEALWEQLRSGSLSRDALAALSTRWDMLPGTLIDALDRAAIRAWGEPVSCWVDQRLQLRTDAADRAERGERPFAQ